MKIADYLETKIAEERVSLDELRKDEIFRKADEKEALTNAFASRIQDTAEQSGYEEEFLNEMLIAQIFEDYDKPMMDVYEYIHVLSIERDW